MMKKYSTIAMDCVACPMESCDYVGFIDTKKKCYSKYICGKCGSYFNHNNSSFKDILTSPGVYCKNMVIL